MNLPIIASKYPPKNRKAVWLQLDDNGGIKSIRKASNNGGFNTLTKTNGITYNEELNSIAIGEETVAIGKDQFVFGRYNIENTDKVEIVGGGLKKQPLSVSSISSLESGTKVLINLPSESTEFVKVGSSLEEVNTFMSTHDFFMHNGIRMEVKALAIIENVNIVCYFGRTYNNGKQHVIYAYSDDGSLYSPISERDTGNYAVWEWRRIGKCDIYESILDRSSNIRTLDWEGNQWNAGDITCDDGNGNTISLRALAQQIASLSTSTTSNEPE